MPSGDAEILTIFKLIDPDTNRVRLIGITNCTKARTIEKIMRPGSITGRANEIICEWIEAKKTPKIQLSDSNVGKWNTESAIKNLAILLNAVALEDEIEE